MGITKIDNFDTNKNAPTDGKMQKADLTERNAIAFPWVGMIVYVTSEDKWYKLDTLPAIDSNNWSEFGVSVSNPEMSIRINVEGGQKTFPVGFDGPINFIKIGIAEGRVSQINITAQTEASEDLDYTGIHLSTNDGTTYSDESGGSGATSVNAYMASKTASDHTELYLTMDTGTYKGPTTITIYYQQL